MKQTKEKTGVGKVMRLRLVIQGAVQGVGFRPFVYRLATSRGLTGWVSNTNQGVLIEAEGEERQLKKFLFALEKEKPPMACIQIVESFFLDPVGYAKFEVRESKETGSKTAIVLPDTATCRDCLSDILNPSNRRYRYPFTNCTNCGPRFSIIEKLPYDRANTTMKTFQMCGVCKNEYDDPADRRFHAQPNACPSCGPHLELWDKNGKIIASFDKALVQAAKAIRRGSIVAVKGLGGFHLMVDARSAKAVRRLRDLKFREEKPFALMAPSLEWIKACCGVSELEERLLLSPLAPIVLLQRQLPGKNNQWEACSLVAPGNLYLGIMLPYTPLHYLIMSELGFPVVATSGNISDEPICTDEVEAVERLGGIADFFLCHNRPIARHVDDSIVRIVAGREMVLRRARGYAPLPIHVREAVSHFAHAPRLAVGAHLKNNVAISIDKEIFISQHIGDLENIQAFDAFKKIIEDLSALYDFKPSMVACDMHPDYLSTRFAEKSGLRVVQVQHHYAHVLSGMAENEISPPFLGVSWDGTGYGMDGTIWGGEFLEITEGSFLRKAHFRQFPLPGGERSVREPRRSALGLLYELLGEKIFEAGDIALLKAFSLHELKILKTMLERKINSPFASSAGRLFDAVAAIIGVRHMASFEGQAAMELEFALDGIQTREKYAFQIEKKEPVVIDWGPMVLEILEDVRQETPAAVISAKFQNTLSEMIVATARKIGMGQVLLTGGCFQNKYLTERVIQDLKDSGIRPYWHQHIPPNDGGISVGQILAAWRSSSKE